MTGMQATKNAAHRPLVISLLWDIALNTAIPAACYFLAKRFISPSEMTDLIAATIFPILKSVYELARRRELDPVAVLVLLGVTASILALCVGGDPRVLLIRESFFTGAFGAACLLSLALPRPIMFYFGRYFIAGKDPQKRDTFNEKWQNPVVRRAHRLITAVWGLVYLGEFAIRVVLVYTLPAPIVLAVTPLLIGVGTMSTIIWTFHYANRVRRISDPKG
ncbi:MAG TPA: VC0807 family protein [Planctomycetota bacterium]|nr:VC0807 family protein [Planctomycetota bacterium]